MQIFDISLDKNRSRRIIQKAEEIVKKGGVIYFPTDTLPGLLAWIEISQSIKKIFDLKKRPFNDPLPIGVSSKEEILNYTEIPYRILDELSLFIPGPLTIIAPAREDKKFPKGVIKKGKIALRVPKYKPVLNLLKRVSPLALTSANIHARRPLIRVMDAIRTLNDDVEYYFIDSRHQYIGSPSTVVEWSCGRGKVVREGVIKKREIEGILNG